MKTAIFALLISASVRAGTLVLPNGLDNVEGNSSAGPLFGAGGGRTQVIYSGSNFSLVPAEGAYITALSFRVDGPNGHAFSTTAEIDIHLSTTQQNPEQLNTLFSANVGSDETLVFPRNTIGIASDFVADGPNSFSIVIPLPTRYLYRPSSGNLLFDARVYDVGSMANLDWQFSPSDGVSSAAGPLTSATAAVVSNNGIVTKFEFEPVPEPSALLLTTFVSFLILTRWRR